MSLTTESRRLSILQTYGINPKQEDNTLQKGGKRAQVGEIRTWDGVQYVKHSDGWVYAKKDGSHGIERPGGKRGPAEPHHIDHHKQYIGKEGGSKEPVKDEPTKTGGDSSTVKGDITNYNQQRIIIQLSDGSSEKDVMESNVDFSQDDLKAAKGLMSEGWKPGQTFEDWEEEEIEEYEEEQKSKGFEVERLEDEGNCFFLLKKGSKEGSKSTSPKTKESGSPAKTKLIELSKLEGSIRKHFKEGMSVIKNEEGPNGDVEFHIQTKDPAGERNSEELSNSYNSFTSSIEEGLMEDGYGKADINLSEDNKGNVLVKISVKKGSKSDSVEGHSTVVDAPKSKVDIYNKKNKDLEKVLEQLNDHNKGVKELPEEEFKELKQKKEILSAVIKKLEKEIK